MSSRVYSLQDYCNDLRSIKAKNVPFIAARMARTLMLLPFKTSSRKYKPEGSSETYDRSGQLFDTRWDENIGAQVSGIQGVTMTDSGYILDRLSELSVHVIRYQRYYTGSSSFVKTLPADSTAVQRMSNKDWIDFSVEIENMKSTGKYHQRLNSISTASSTAKGSTYVELGYFLNQSTLANPVFTRQYDLYNFLKDVSGMDIYTWIYTIKNFIKNAKTPDSEYFPILSAYADILISLVSKVVGIILEMEHKIDDIAPIMNVGAQSENDYWDVKDADPINEETISGFDLESAGWPAPAYAQPTSWNNSFEIKAYGRYRLAVSVKYPYRLESISLNSNDIEVITLNDSRLSGQTGANYISMPFVANVGDIVSYTIGSTTSGVSSVDTSKVSMYVYLITDNV